MFDFWHTWIWALLLMAGAVVIALLLHGILFGLLRRFTRDTSNAVDNAFVVRTRGPARLAWRQIMPILWLLAFAVPVQWIFAGWEAAATMGLRLLVAVALAAVYTLTTPVSATLDAMQVLLRPFRRWADPDRIGLALALAIRCVPLLAELVREVLEARKARGAEGSPTAFAVPVIVRALRTADHLGEALMARGVDD